MPGPPAHQFGNCRVPQVQIFGRGIPRTSTTRPSDSYSPNLLRLGILKWLRSLRVDIQHVNHSAIHKSSLSFLQNI